MAGMPMCTPTACHPCSLEKAEATMQAQRAQHERANPRLAKAVARAEGGSAAGAARGARQPCQGLQPGPPTCLPALQRTRWRSCGTTRPTAAGTRRTRSGARSRSAPPPGTWSRRRQRCGWVLGRHAAGHAAGMREVPASHLSQRRSGTPSASLSPPAAAARWRSSRSSSSGRPAVQRRRSSRMGRTTRNGTKRARTGSTKMWRQTMTWTWGRARRRRMWAAPCASQ